MFGIVISTILSKKLSKLSEIAASINMDLSDFKIINVVDTVEASLAAVKLVHDGEADMYLKGLLDTKTYLKSVLDKEVGLRTDKTLSHVCVFECEGIDRLLFLTDVAFLPYPTLEDKVAIINNTVEIAHACGIECPKVAGMAAVEVVNPKMKETVEAFELSKMQDEGKITGCIVDGPLSMDCALYPHACEDVLTVRFREMQIFFSSLISRQETLYIRRLFTWYLLRTVTSLQEQRLLLYLQAVQIHVK